MVYCKFILKRNGLGNVKDFIRKEQKEVRKQRKKANNKKEKIIILYKSE